MKQVLLALILIAAPVAAFSAYLAYVAPGPEAVASLGDMSAFKTIVADVQSVALSGDLVAAETRVTDFETAWDDAEPTVRPLDPVAWGLVDGAADKAFRALRATAPDPTNVSAALTALMAALDNPTASAGGSSGVSLVSGIAVTDSGGHAIPCEEMLKALRTAVEDGTIPAANVTAAAGFQAKATERCNADDDANADAFSAQGLALAAR